MQADTKSDLNSWLSAFSLLFELRERVKGFNSTIDIDTRLTELQSTMDSGVVKSSGGSASDDVPDKLSKLQQQIEEN